MTAVGKTTDMTDESSESRSESGAEVKPAPRRRSRASLPWPRSTRARLTVWYAVVFVLVFALFGLAFFLNVRATLTTSLDSALHTRTVQIAAGITPRDGGITIDDVTGTLPGLAPGPQDIDDTPTGSTTGAGVADGDGPSADMGDQTSASSVDVSVGTLVGILNTHGQRVYVSPAFERLSVPQQSVAAALKGASWTGDVTSGSGQRVRLYSMPLTTHNGAVFGVIQVGEPLAPLEATLRTVLLEWLLIAPFAVLLSALGGYYLASRAFRPITHLIGTAQRIEAEDLHQRVPVPPTHDEVQQLALTFNAMISRLEDAFARQRSFVADASHELGTPVAAIRSLSEVALSGERGAGGSEDYEASLRSISGEAERLGRLVADLLALARADENRIPLEREAVRLETLVADVVAVLEPLASERSVALELQTTGPVTVIGDEARLIQAVFNLLDNAIAYSDRAGGATRPAQDRPGAQVVTDERATNISRGARVLVRVETEDDSALVRVTDSGIGIALEHLPHIFERFYRVDPSRSRASGGSGLGLAIVDWVVRAHHGSVAVQSEVGHGSTFTMTLPLASAEASPSIESTRRAPGKA